MVSGEELVIVLEAAARAGGRGLRGDGHAVRHLELDGAGTGGADEGIELPHRAADLLLPVKAHELRDRDQRENADDGHHDQHLDERVTALQLLHGRRDRAREMPGGFGLAIFLSLLVFAGFAGRWSALRCGRECYKK